MLTKIISLRSFTLLAAVESLAAVRCSSRTSVWAQHPVATVFGIFVVHYAFLAVYALFVYPRWLHPMRHLLGPKTIISMSHRAGLQKKRPSGDLYLDVVKQHPNQDLLALSLVQNFYLVTNPGLLADVFNHRAYDFIKPPRIVGFLKPLLGEGLIVVEGDRHKFLRKNTSPAFTFRNIKNLYPMMWEKAVALTAAMRDEETMDGDGVTMGKDGVMELRKWTSKVTLDIIGLAGLGRNFDTVRNAQDPLFKTYEQLLSPSKGKLAHALASMVLGMRLVGRLPWSQSRKFNRLTTSLGEICRELIREKRVGIEEKADDHFDILSLLIKSGNFSDGELTDQLLTFLAAGHETTSSAMCWAAFMLAKHQDAQKKVREEVLAALPRDSATQSSADMASTLEQLPYLNGVMNETLRLYPTAPLTMRRAIRNTRVGSHVIPKDNTLVISIWALHRSPEVWGPDAGDFRPERWITEDKDGKRPNRTGGARSNYEFLTFLQGPRSCIGQDFVRAEMRCLLAALVGAFEWELGMREEDVVPRGIVTIKPEGGLWLRMKPLEPLDAGVYKAV